MVEAARTPSAEFAVRVLRYLAAEAGVRQFLELSRRGGPDAGEVVRRIAPDALVIRPDGERDVRRVISRRLDPSRQVAVLWLGAPAGEPATGVDDRAGEPPAARGGAGEPGAVRDGADEPGVEPRTGASEPGVEPRTGAGDPAAGTDYGANPAAVERRDGPDTSAGERRDGVGVAAVIAGVMAAVPSGSYLALCCADARWLTGRLAGLALVEPGLVPVTDWRPDYPPAPVSGPVTAHGALARKP